MSAQSHSCRISLFHVLFESRPKFHRCQWWSPMGALPRCWQCNFEGMGKLSILQRRMGQKMKLLIKPFKKIWTQHRGSSNILGHSQKLEQLAHGDYNDPWNCAPKIHASQPKVKQFMKYRTTLQVKLLQTTRIGMNRKLAAFITNNLKRGMKLMLTKKLCDKTQKSTTANDRTK